MCSLLSDLSPTPTNWGTCWAQACQCCPKTRVSVLNLGYTCQASPDWGGGGERNQSKPKQTEGSAVVLLLEAMLPAHPAALNPGRMLPMQDGNCA